MRLLSSEIWTIKTTPRHAPSPTFCICSSRDFSFFKSPTNDRPLFEFLCFIKPRFWSKCAICGMNAHEQDIVILFINTSQDHGTQQGLLTRKWAKIWGGASTECRDLAGVEPICPLIDPFAPRELWTDTPGRQGTTCRFKAILHATLPFNLNLNN